MEYLLGIGLVVFVGLCIYLIVSTVKQSKINEEIKLAYFIDSYRLGPRN